MRAESQRMMLENQRMMLEMVKSQNQPFVKSANEIAVIGEMFSKKSPDVLGLIREGLTLIREWREDSEPVPADPLTMMIDKVFKVVAPMLQAGVAKLAVPNAAMERAPSPALPAPVPVAAGNPAAVNSLPSANPPATPVASPVPDAAIVNYAAQLKAAILAGSKADATALFVLDSLEENDLPTFGKFVFDPGIVGRFLEADRTLIEHQAWIAQFFQVLKEELTEAPSATPESSTVAGGV